MKTKLVIFDLDGTLLNSLQDLADSGNYVLTERGYKTHQLADYQYFVGDGIPKLIERILPEHARTADEMAEVKAAFLDYYQQHKADKTVVYNGVTALLEALQRAGVRLAVASNKAHEAMQPLIAHYFPTVQFSAIFGQRQGVPTKPDPAIVADILRCTGISANDALYVGDTAVDMRTAERAQVESVGVLWGYRTKAELVAARAQHLIAKPEELLTIIKEKR